MVVVKQFGPLYNNFKATFFRAGWLEQNRQNFSFFYVAPGANLLQKSTKPAPPRGEEKPATQGG